MAFKIVKNPRAWWPVTFAGVTEDGEVIENSFEMRFKILDEDETAEVIAEFSALGDKMAADETPTDELPKPSAIASKVVLRIAEDWRGVTMDDGTEAGASLPFSADNLTTLLNVPNVLVGIGNAYRACRAGQSGARRGN